MKTFKISNFKEFLFEKFVDSDLSSGIKRFCMLVKKPFPTDTESDLGKMIGEVRNALFDQVSVDSSNVKSLEIPTNLPVLNFTENNDLVRTMLSSKLIDRDSLYNHPDSSDAVSDKVKFHRAFEKFEFVPKTVFSVEEAADLKFPVIAKPATGKSASGIMKFSSAEELRKTKETFDLFSEMIDIAREFRCFCFRDEVISIDERVKVEGAKDFLSDVDTTTDFVYKPVEQSKYAQLSKLKKVLSDCRKVTDLDFFSVDFAENPESDIFLIEMNSRTGMGAEKMVDLYRLIYRDFYGSDVPSEIDKRIGKIKSEWGDLYKKEKHVNECTIVAGNVDDSFFLFKNRDRSYTPDTVIVREKLSGTEIVYYTDQIGWVEGMNEHGVGFVMSQLTEIHRPGYKASWHVSDEPKSTKKFEKFADSIRKILTAKDADQALKLLEKSGKSGNFLIGDAKNLYEVEVFKGETRKRKLDFSENCFYVKTNHGVLFPEAGHQSAGDSIKRSSSTIRKHQAEIQLAGITGMTEIPSRMKYQAFDPSSSLNVFRTDPEEYTISQCLMNLGKLMFFFFHDRTTADTIKVEDSVKNPKIVIDVRDIR